jgi:uncharacterized membrane protein YphA (DoxX/SURF4 family)
MKTALGLTRIIVGVLFIFSGLIKANDPLGLSYKMQEFFEVWGWGFLDNLTLAFSILMIAFEIIAGVAVLLGWRMRLFAWLLLLLIIFFSFLTGFALLSGKIRTCGCFGDCIPLTAGQSFTKDLVLLALIVFLFVYRRQIKPLFRPALSLLLLVITTLFSFGAQWYVLRFLPVVDCLPYKIGNNIPEKMKVPPGAVPDSTVITFVYDRKGKQVEFSSEHFPEDFDDSLYQFIRRYDKLVRKGNAEPAIKDFALLTINGNDTTQAVLNTEGCTVLCFTRGFEEMDPVWINNYKSIRYALSKRNIPFYFITNDYENTRNWAAKNSEAGDKNPVLKCDFVAIKTAARANPTIYLLKKGTILNKWSYVLFDDAAKALEALPVQTPAAAVPIIVTPLTDSAAAAPLTDTIPKDTILKN